MTCKICNGKRIKSEYNGLIRNGGLGQYTSQQVTMWKCEDCGAIWHEPILDNSSYYESQEYRKALEGTSEEEDFYRLHDKENLDKLTYTGTTIYRDQIVTDIGCGCGAFLDFVSGASRKVVAIEPSETYRKILSRKGFHTYAYATEAIKDYGGQVGVVTSFDVIEHVENPQSFIQDAYDLLMPGGKAIIGTPTDAPVMRSLLGEDYEKKLLFSTQHLWVLGEKNLRLMAENVGIPPKNIRFQYYQRYGIANMLGWIKNKEPKKAINDSFVTDTLDSVWRSEVENQGLADYIVLYFEK